MNGFMHFLNIKFAPGAQKIDNNDWIVTIKNSILAAVILGIVVIIFYREQIKKLVSTLHRSK